MDENHLERFLATIETFVRNLDVTSTSNPYRVTLRKLWSKMAETDGRTVLKGTFLLHAVLRYTQPEDTVIFKALISKMSREDCRKTRCKYFDFSREHKRISAESAHLEDFIERYQIYVMKRAKTFTSSFEEMKLIAHGMKTEDICAQVSDW